MTTYFHTSASGDIRGAAFDHDAVEGVTDEEAKALFERVNQGFQSMTPEQRAVSSISSYCAGWAMQKLYVAYFAKNSPLRAMLFEAGVDGASTIIDAVIKASWQEGARRFLAAEKHGLVNNEVLESAPGFILDFGPIVGPIVEKAQKSAAVDAEGAPRQ